MPDAVVLAGGAAARLSGADKPGVVIGAASMLERVLDAAAPAERIVVVGPRREVDRDVTWCLEEPPGSGPVAALAAAVPYLGADVVLVLAADLPWIAPAVPRLTDALGSDPTAAAAVLVTGGRRNYLAAAWRRSALLEALAAVPELRGAAMRQLYAEGRVVDVIDTDDAGRDCDTWADIDVARLRAQTTEETL